MTFPLIIPRNKSDEVHNKNSQFITPKIQNFRILMNHDKQSLQRGQVSCCTSHLSKHLLWNKCLHLRSLISPPSSISYIHNTHSAASSEFQFSLSYLITPILISEMETFCSKSIGWRHENKTESTSQDKRCRLT